MLVRSAIVFLLFYDTGFVDSAIIGTPSSHHVNNIISKGEQGTTLTKIQTGGHAKTILNQPGHGRNTTKANIEIKTPTKVTLPLTHNTNKPTPIVHSLPWSIHKKTSADLLKQEVPKPQKKVYHHFNVKDLIQRRKELKEKWQARHNKLLQMTPHGLHSKNVDNPEVSTNYPEKPRVQKKITKWNTPMAKKENMVNTQSDNLKKNIAVSYEQVTPRTRRILEHKEEETQSLEDNTKPLHPRFSARYHARSTIPPITENTAIIQSVMRDSRFSGDDNSISLEMLPKSELNDAKHTTESHTKPANEYSPYIPMIPEIHWPTRITTELTTPTSSKRRELSATSSILTSSTEGTERLFIHDHAMKSRNVTPSEITLKNPDLGTGVGGIAILNRDPRFEHDTRLEFAPERTTSDTPTLGTDDVVSVKIDTAKTTKEVSTTRIDTAPYHRNLTDREKVLYQKPSFNYGRSAEHEEHAFDVNLPIKIGEVVQGKSTGEGFANESIENSSQISVENSNSALKRTAIPPERRAMKIAVKPQVNQDWRENLRRAVKERLTKLKRDSLVR